ncbi:MAG: hypothetical protein SFY66_15790 [Oculatellaceae cyanobacterium bins.114]|nr:hypothetical protein [Oculatellaceae cyanobacterium bins.114]
MLPFIVFLFGSVQRFYSQARLYLSQIEFGQSMDALTPDGDLLRIAPVAPEFIWTQLLTALMVGLLTALAFQLLLTTLGVAIGISIWRIRWATHDSSSDEPKSPNSSSGIGTMAGFGILLTVNTVLFGACFLAAKFSQVASPMSGAIEGIVIWSAYFLLLIWVSSRAVGSLVGSLLDITTGGFRRIVSAIAAVFNKEDNKEDDPTPALSEEQVVSTVRQEMQTLLNTIDLRQLVEEQLEEQLQSISLPDIPQWQLEESKHVRQQQRAIATEVWQNVEAYLHNTSVKSLTSKRIDRKLKKLLQTQTEQAEIQFIPQFDQAKLVALLAQRADLSEKQRDRITDQIETSWQEVMQAYDQHRTSVEVDADSSPSPRLPSQLTAKALQSVLNATIERVLGTLPDVLQQVGIKMPNWSELAPVVLSIALAKMRDSFGTDILNTLSSDYPDLKQTLDRLLKTPQASLPGLNPLLLSPVKYLRDRSLEQIESIQQVAQDSIEAVKQNTQQRAEDTRKTAATAAWWLFLTASTGAISSAIAGALATGFRFT